MTRMGLVVISEMIRRVQGQLTAWEKVYGDKVNVVK